METLKSERVGWIDIAKGIGILLVIIGHTIELDILNEKIVNVAIYSFHMPLFFTLSSVTFKFSESNDQFVRKTERAFKHLIFPTVILFCFRVIIDILQNYYKIIEWKDYAVKKINTFVYASGVNADVMGTSVLQIGVLWFFVVLFLGRSLFDYLHLKLNKKQFVFSMFVCTISGVLLGQLQWLPLSFDVVLAVMPFFYFGYYLKKIDMKKNTLLYGSVSFAIWIAGLILMFCFNGRLSVARRMYPFFPICYIVAAAGIMFICYLSAALEDSVMHGILQTINS